MIAHMLKRLRSDHRGVTVVEFAIVTPVMVTLLLGLSDLMYQAYVQSILDGAVIKAGRDSALEGNSGDQSAIDNKVKAMVGMLGPNMRFTPERKSYPSFALIKPENIDDTNRNGRLDTGECFYDLNGNRTWDTDPSRDTQGGANDVTRYTMTVKYPRLFPVSALFGWEPTETVTSTTLLKNQPYRTQGATTTVRVCL